uniref:Uncharacterized protein n=1 Tax=Anguilla anguilla TaxID=7936 RepID=A0A0E9TLJ7_ANGAN
MDRVTAACSADMDYVYKVKVVSAALTHTIDRLHWPCGGCHQRRH